MGRLVERGDQVREPVPGTVDIEALLASMSLEEKLAQLVGLWLGPEEPTAERAGFEVAPLQNELLRDQPSVEEFTRHGLGQLTRPMGVAPTDPAHAVEVIARLQLALRERTRLGIPALIHEECLTGLQVYGATTYPCPLAWGASWHPQLVERTARAIGRQMRDLGVHLGLAPVLDVVTDPRWGRVEECIAEDPYLVGVIGTAYVRGLQSTGVGATLKHFVGYSASQAGRNHAPVHIGSRELAEIYLLPFEMAVREAQPSSVMHSYAALDGVPVASDAGLLRGLLRQRWCFEGTVLADYFGITFLDVTQNVARDRKDAAVIAMHAGVDVELPTGDAYREPLADAVRSGACAEHVVDEAVRRVLRQKVDLGVFAPAQASDQRRQLDLDPPEHRATARRLAEASVILLENHTGLLPLRGARRVAVVGPNAASSHALMGSYSFTNHVEVPPGTPLGIDVPTVLEALRAEFGKGVVMTHEPGCDVTGVNRSRIAEAVNVARHADVCIAVVGDRAGLFGRGTVGEGSDTDDLDLPGLQRELVEQVLESATPVVLVVVTGRPRAIGWARGRAGAIVQAFFPGEEGAAAIAGVLSGRINPSGRLPVSIPSSTGVQPYTYLHPRLGAAGAMSNVDPAPAFPFGHGLSYTRFRYSDLTVTPEQIAVDGVVEVACTVTNEGERSGVEIAQLYSHDVAASVTRPLRQLTGWARVQLEPGACARVTFSVSADRLSFVGRDLERIVEPGAIDFAVARSSVDEGLSRRVELVGPVRTVSHERQLHTTVRISRLSSRHPAEVVT